MEKLILVLDILIAMGDIAIIVMILRRWKK